MTKLTDGRKLSPKWGVREAESNPVMLQTAESLRNWKHQVPLDMEVRLNDEYGLKCLCKSS